MIKICALGSFAIIDTDSGVCLDDDGLRSDMLKKLITYLVIHREHPVTVQELFGALWQDDETENPAGALKNLMYRLRAVMKKNFGDTTFVVTGSGTYSWNPQVETVLDVEEFEKNVKRSKASKDANEATRGFEEALEMYRGEFLENCADKHWMVTSATYYHSMYLTAVKRLATLYLKAERFADVENICTRALRFDDVDEQIYCDLIKSLIGQQKNELALKNFENAKKVLQDALGVRGTKKLAEVEKELLKMNKGAVVENIENIYDDMAEEEDVEGVYLCGYPVFREIYRVEARKMTRVAEAEHVLLLTAELGEEVDDSNEHMTRFLIKQAMGQLEKALKRTLRVGDIAARYSDTQFIVLLPSCTYEATKAVAKRVINDFKSLQRSKKVIVKPQMEQVESTPSVLVR